MEILIIGGAGYIGSTTNRILLERGIETTVLDDLSTGHREAITPGTKFVEGDFGDRNILAHLFSEYSFDAVIHFGAKSIVSESKEKVLEYYQNNVAKTITLLEEMKKARVQKLLFSSTAAVYGHPKKTPIGEDHPLLPISPYGQSKLMVEQILMDAAGTSDFRYVSLRYFNAAGAWLDGSAGEDHKNESHLIPRILKTIISGKSDGEELSIYGSDYETKDGTCIRDYIHVLDLAEAHAAALFYLVEKQKLSDVFNLGIGRGYSVLEIIKAVERIVGKSIPVTKEPRRPGDPPVLVASNHKSRKELGWWPKYSDLDTIIESAWKWHSNNPKGFQTDRKK